MKVIKFNHKINAIKKLKDIGVKDEKELMSAAFDRFLTAPGISIPELIVMSEIKKAVKQGKLLAYLMKEEPANEFERKDE